jgi:type III restriction enzyme
MVITNFHAFQRRDKFEAASLTKKVLAGPGGNLDAFRESPDEMVRRVCRDLGSKRGVVLLNDEAHHCYREKPDDVEEGKLGADEKAEAKENAETARVWISGLDAVRAKVGIRNVYDLSATPFFLRGSGYSEGTLFPWVVSDFSLIDAIESGIVKVPRVPVADNQMTAAAPVYRELWRGIRDKLPRKGRTATTEQLEPRLPVELEGALRSLYGHYEKAFERWAEVGMPTVPVFIVVCNNTNVSKLVFDWVAGWEKVVDGSSVLVPGNLDLFNNVDGRSWATRPNTILIDSAQLESGKAMDDAFKKLATAEIHAFKEEYKFRTGRDPEGLTDEDMLREVMNTVGKPGRLGGNVRCVISVSMLTEGWDANTVTHILGVRAFGTQLLCEQVVGRGLRRASYVANDEGFFEPEYAEVYGVPFSFIPASGAGKERIPKPVHRVRAIDDRIRLEITFPRVIGYRWEMSDASLQAAFTDASRMSLSTQDVPTKVEVEPIAGEGAIHDLSDLRETRLQAVAFRVSRRILDEHLRDGEGYEKPWLFPQVLRITRRWLDECVTCKDSTFLQMLRLVQLESQAAEKVFRSIVEGTAADKRLVPILRPYDPVGTTRLVAFDTTKPVYTTDPDKCHLNYVTEDSKWEGKLAASLEEMDEVICYVKNQGLIFAVPYTHEGKSANYLPDYIVRVDVGDPEPLNLVIEVSGEAKKDKQAKVATAKTFWIPSINNHGGFGRWSFLEVSDPWDAANLIRAHLGSMRSPAVAEASRDG